MLNAFHISASSMQAHQVYVDVIANNLANINTTGFKKSKVEFEDVMYTNLAAARGNLAAADIQNSMGMGATVGSIEKVFSQGEVKNTGMEFDLVIQGKGFFEVMLPEGDYAYTRTGRFQIDGEGMLVNPDGYKLSPAIQIPVDAKGVLINTEGAVLVDLPGESGPLEVGRIELASVINPSGLTPVGDNLYRTSQNSGDAYYGVPGEEDFGLVSQGYLESSNVSLIDELTTMMMARRGYEVNAKVIQTADDMLSIVNNLKR